MQLDVRQLRKKILSIQKIEKIARSLKIVAAMKINKLTKLAEKSEDFFHSVQNFYDVIASFHQFNQKKVETTIWIFITSDMGLCGGYNSKILKNWKENGKATDKVIVIGKKGINYFKVRNKKTLWSISAADFNWETIQKLSHFLTTEFNLDETNIRTVKIEGNVGNKTTFLPFQIWPLNYDSSPRPKISSPLSAELLVEPSVSTATKFGHVVYLAYFLQQLNFVGRLNEERMRAIAMENANQNAEEIVQELKLKYNQQRQEKITREIITVSQI